MDDSFETKIKNCAASRSGSIKFAPVSDQAIEEAEAQLKFPIPPLLKFIYLQVGNGGFGPGRGGNIIGLKGGYESDFGNLVATYQKLKGDCELEGEQWRSNLLPFCEWGCNIFSCVDCKKADYPIYEFEQGDVSRKECTLDVFFKLWIEGVDILSYEGGSSESEEVTNPFTGQKMRVRKRRKT